MHKIKHLFFNIFAGIISLKQLTILLMIRFSILIIDFNYQIP